MSTHSQPDICARKHQGNAQSVLAFDGLKPFLNEQRRLVYEWLIIQQEKGGTVKECSRDLHIGYTSASARLSDLVINGYATETGERREGCGVRRAVVIG